MTDIQHEIFTDLSLEQAAIVEGGAFRLNSIECLTASADPIGGDEPYINADGKRIWSASMQQGDILRINKTISSPSVSLYDDDSWPNPDDPIGSATLSRRRNVAYLGGGNGNSYYKLNYTVV